MIIEGLLDYLNKREELLRKELETAIAMTCALASSKRIMSLTIILD